MSAPSSQNEHEEEDEGGHILAGPMHVSKLQEAGFSAQDIKKLSEAGLNTIESVAYTPKKAIMGIKGISEQKAEKMINEGMCAPSLTLIDP